NFHERKSESVFDRVRLRDIHEIENGKKRTRQVQCNAVESEKSGKTLNSERPGESAKPGVSLKSERPARGGPGVLHSVVGVRSRWGRPLPVNYSLCGCSHC